MDTLILIHTIHSFVGGDFTDELQAAGISKHKLFPVSEMVPSVDSEKFVLYIAADEIRSFKMRLDASAVK